MKFLLRFLLVLSILWLSACDDMPTPTPAPTPTPEVVNCDEVPYCKQYKITVPDVYPLLYCDSYIWWDALTLKGCVNSDGRELGGKISIVEPLNVTVEKIE